jgi:hypothetical protein
MNAILVVVLFCLLSEMSETSFKTRYFSQIDVTYDPNDEVDKMCRKLAVEAITQFPEDNILSSHVHRQLAIFLTSLEQSRDALAKAHAYIGK